MKAQQFSLGADDGLPFHKKCGPESPHYTLSRSRVTGARDLSRFNVRWNGRKKCLIRKQLEQ
jgi:hypothetical protein